MKELIENKFSRKTFESYVKDNFNLNIEKGLLEDNIKKSNDKEDTNIKSYQKIATMTKANKDNISFFVFESKTKNIINKRVGYSDFIKKLSTKYEFDGAVVAIYHPDSDVWRLSFVSVEFTDNDKTKLQTTPKRYTFELGAVPHKTALEQLSILDKNSTKEDFLKAFSVEKLSDDFFKEYKKIYYIVLNILKPEIALFENKNKNKNNISYFTKKLLGRIIFLYFLQKKGWLGSKETWGDGDKKFISNGFENYKNNNFYKDILQPIFFEALNTKRKDDYFELLHCKMPFLNGGLFSKDEFDDETLLSLDNIVFENIFKLFDSYNFTIIEDTLNDKEVAIDPEMLGRIFEDLLEDRKDKGAFYTPRQIVHYMCQQSIINYLSLSFDKSEAIEALVLNQKTDNSYIRTNAKKIQQKLKHIKVLDPAIGSGAFPMGMLHEIVQILSNIDKTANIVELKKQVIQDSIYGIDIETSAVEIAKLRFWLSIVVDDEVPTPLPNLFYKIMVGNSLIETINGFDPLERKEEGGSLLDKRDGLYISNDKIDEIQKLQKQYFKESNIDKKLKIQDNIDKNIKNIFDIKIKEYDSKIQTKKETLAKGANTATKNKLTKEIECDIDNSLLLKHIIGETPTTKLFFYKLYFADVIDCGGFDIVIGNPPYVDYRKIDSDTKKELNNSYTSYKHSKQGSLYVYFIEKGLKLLKTNGVLSYINPYQYFTADSGFGIRKYLIDNISIESIIDVSNIKIFKFASVYTCINTFKKNIANNNIALYRPKNLKSLEANKKSINYQNIKNEATHKIIFSNSSILDKVDTITTTIDDYMDIFCGTSQSGFRSSVIPIEEYTKLSQANQKKYVLFLETREIQRYFHKAKKAIKKDIYSENVCIKMKKNQEHLFFGRMTKTIRVTKSHSDDIYVGKVNVLTNSKLNINFLMAILNSKLINYYYFKKNESKHLNGGYLGFDIPSIKEIPVKVSKNTKPFIDIVDKIINLKAQDQDTTRLENEIDVMVYRLYGLSSSEIGIVEGK